MTYDEIFERLPGLTVVDVAEAKGGGLAILMEADFSPAVPVGPAILVVGGDNETVCVQGGDWETFWDNVRECGTKHIDFGDIEREKEGGVVIMPE